MTRVSSSILWAALLALLSMPALAADAKKTTKKKDEKGAAATATNADKKAEARKKEERRGPASLKEVPKLEDAEKEALADKKRDEAIESLKKIIPKIEDGSPQRAELLFQLSELYWEKSKYLYRKEMLKFQDDEKKVDDARNKGEKVADAKEDHRESELFRTETMRFYETILREYPSYDRKDEVLFSLGYNLYETNKKDQAVKRYEELIKNYPGSKFVPDTYVQLGNHYFEVAANLSKAKEYYEKAFASTVPKIKSYALYKLAWCDYNAGDYERALKRLQDVIEYSEQQGKTFTDLKNEALNDSVLMFVQLNRADDAVAYFKAHAGKKKQVSLTSKFAFALGDAGHHENSIKILRLLLNDNPIAEAAPDFQQAIIKSYESLRQRDNVKAETKKMAELYRPGSSWWKANESKKEVLRNGFAVAEEAMRVTVTEYHREAQQTKQVETYRVARDIYKQYVDAFAAGDDENFISDYGFNMKFFYAEILWALEEWENAAKQYDEVTAFKIPNRDEAKQAADEKYRQRAAYASILAYSKLVQIERGIIQKTDLKDGAKIDENKKKGEITKSGKLQKRSAKELQEQALTKYELALAAACDKYNQAFPKNPDEIDVAYSAATIYYDKNHFVEAARRFGDIIQRFPEEKRSRDAADLSMAVLEEKEEWFELNKLSRQFLANKRLLAGKDSAEFAKRVTGVVEGSQYKYVDEVIYKKEKNAQKAAEEYLKFVAEFPKSDNADRALTYAMVIFEDANQLDRSTETGERVLKEYPSSIFDLKVKVKLAKGYERIANFEKSASMYEDFIATYDAAAGTKAIGYDNVKDLLKKEKEAAEKEAKAKKGAKPAAPAAKTAAAAPAKKLDEAKQKERDAQVKEAEAFIADSQFNAGLWWEGLGKSDKAISAYNHYIARFKDKSDVPEIAFNIGLILEKDKKWADAIKYYDQYLTTYAKDARVKDLRKLDIKYRQYLMQKTLKNTAEQDKLAKEIIAAYPKLSAEDKKNDRALLAVANARFVQLEPMWKAYTDIKFNKLGTLKADLIAKQKKIQEVTNSYEEVLKIGNGEYGIAALTRIGLAYGDLSQNLLDSPDPKGLDEDQLSMYRGELENRAFPLEEKSIEALEKALAKSYELSIYNEWTILAQDKINKYKPGLYGKVRDVQYRGAEFFATAPVEKKAPVDAAPAPAAAPPASKEAQQPAPPPTSASAATPAGAR
ncbi:MAG: tetratricopeptide repeat protein [Myxococcaceae bacterium]|nr:tetratricopeptide repeat protein [Myxococcaceae bacterium]